MARGGASGTIPLPGDDFVYLISLAEDFMDMVNEVGDWLLSTPDDFHFFVYDNGQNSLFTIPNPFGSVAQLILTGSILTLLVVRLVRFILDVI